MLLAGMCLAQSNLRELELQLFTIWEQRQEQRHGLPWSYGKPVTKSAETLSQGPHGVGKGYNRPHRLTGNRMLH